MKTKMPLPYYPYGKKNCQRISENARSVERPAISYRLEEGEDFLGNHMFSRGMGRVSVVTKLTKNKQLMPAVLRDQPLWEEGEFLGGTTYFSERMEWGSGVTNLTKISN